MALSIISVSPTEGITPGKDRLTIEGTDFDIHPFPPPPGFIGNSQGPSVIVRVDGIEAESVAVYPKIGGLAGETTIQCSTPRFTGDPESLPAVVDVEVENLLTPGTVTLSSSYTYRRPNAIPNSGLSLLVSGLLKELARQCPIPSTRITQRVHTDFDESTGDGLNLIQIAGTPTLWVQGPTLLKSEGVYSNYNTVKDVDGDPLNWIKARAVFPRDLVFTLTLIDENDARLLNLMDMLDRFVQDNGTLKIEKTLGVPADGFHEYDMDWASRFDADQSGNFDNLISATAALIVRGVMIERIGDVTTERAVLTDEQGVVLEVEKIG